jgi:hypothetical protein
MKKLFLQIAISIFTKELFVYLEELTKNSEYQELRGLLLEAKAFSNAVSPSALASLSKQKSKEQLVEAYRQHDERLLMTAYNLAFEIIDKKVKENALLNSFEQSIYTFGKELVQVYTNDNLENREEAKAVFKANRKSLLLSSLEQTEYLVNNSPKIDSDVKGKIQFAFTVAKGVVAEMETLT